MNVFQIESVKKTYHQKTGKLKYRTVKNDVAFPSEVGEVTFKMWCDYFQMKEVDPDWAKELEKMSAELQLEVMATWTDEQWLSYYLLILQYLTCFTQSDLKDLANAPLMGDAGNGLVSIYLMLIGMVNSYEPTAAETYWYKGDTYIIDKVETDRFNRTVYGKNMTANQMVDALQYEHVFSVKDEKGKFLINDRKFQIDIALIAVLSKKVLKDGSFDERPLDYVQRQEWTEAKIQHFMDAPMTIALDVSFFLRSSKSKSQNIRTLSSFSRVLKSSLTRRR